MYEADSSFIKTLFKGTTKYGLEQESNPVLAALGYYNFYENYFLVNGYSLASYMLEGSESYALLESSLRQAVEDAQQSPATVLSSIQIPGEMGNEYVNYAFMAGMSFSLINKNPPDEPEEPSSEPEEPPVPPTTPTISIRKVWVEDTDETRPDSILVEIYHDEELYDTVEVEEKYNWRASYNIPSRYEHDDWWVAEADVPAGYEDYVDETRDNVFVITNTYTVEEEESSEGSSEIPVEPSGPSEYIPPESSEPASEPQPAEEPAEPTLPQTGQLWWPVPALLLCGAVAVAFGAFKRRG